MTPLPIAVDAMGGDRAPDIAVGGAIRAAEQGLPVILVGPEGDLARRIPRGLPLTIAHAAEHVSDSERPATAVRRRPDASINVAMRLVSDKRARAVVSCGPTGAIMTAALLGLGRLPGVLRPAVTVVVPRMDGGRLVLLDMGANVDCRPEMLAQFALMGHCYARQVLGTARPRVGLLSNGEEDTKGNDLVRRARPLVAELPVRFAGSVEPLAAFRGACDVLVCDGFVGNVMLKTVEATVEIVTSLLRQEIRRHPSARFGAWLLTSALRRFREQADYAAVGGALLLGVGGVVVVGHGRSDDRAVHGAIRQAHGCAGEGLSERIAAAVGAALQAPGDGDVAR